MEGMNQFGIYTWKCHNEILYRYLKQKILACTQKWSTGRKNRSCPGVGTSGEGEDIRKRYRRVNMMEMLYTDA
jgi:hypothetical protein